jgi:diguanylate cyclase (GGDEF)-like protein
MDRPSTPLLNPAPPLRLDRALQLLAQSGQPQPEGEVGSAVWLQGVIDALVELSSRDALTGLANRRSFDLSLAREVDRVARSGEPALLLALDIDHFKRVNDRYGHIAGDAVIQAVAAALLDSVRPMDLVARVGGEEFVICCAGADAAGARSLAERLREAARSLELGATDGHGGVGCSISIGVSRPFRTLADWPRAAGEADRALYAAKAAGCDRVCTA